MKKARWVWDASEKDLLVRLLVAEENGIIHILKREVHQPNCQIKIGFCTCGK